MRNGIAAILRKARELAESAKEKVEEFYDNAAEAENPDPDRVDKLYNELGAMEQAIGYLDVVIKSREKIDYES